ncbi:MAG: ClpXP protease specificity-enhancing factor [bacterium]
MSSSRPYLVRAIYQWIVDNGVTPHLLVAADYPGTVVPREFVEESRIVLNIHPNAVRDLHMGDDFIMFSGRFAGSPMDLEIPVPAVMALYAKENGQGMVFEDNLPEPEPPSSDDKGSDDRGQTPDSEKKAGRPSLRLVK